MPEIDPVLLQLRADVAQYNLNISQASRLSEQKFGAIDRASTAMGSSVKGGLNAAASAALSFASKVSAVDLAKRFLDYAEASKKVDVQLKAATATFGSWGQAQQDVDRIAASSRVGLEATTQAYASFLRGAEATGVSQGDAARATETFSQALRISGASAEEASTATVEFGKALATGKVSGDALNEALETSPRLARLLADSMGQPIEEIVKLGEEGQLSSDKLLRALSDQRFTGGIEEDFNALPQTIDDALTAVNNSAIKVFGAFDRGGQFSTAIANFVTDGSNSFSDLENAAESFGASLSTEIAGVISVFQQLKGLIDAISSTLAGGFLGKAISAANTAAGYLNPLTLTGKVVDRLGAEAQEEQRRKLNRQSVDRAIDETIASGKPRQKPSPAPTPALTPALGRHSGGGSNRPLSTGPSAAEIADREAAAVDRLEEDELRARAALAATVEERESIAKELLFRERNALIARLEKQKALTPDAQKLIDTIYGAPSKTDPKTGNVILEARPGLMAQDINRKSRQEQARLDDELLQQQADTLQAQAGIADSSKERRRLGERALHIQQEIERSQLDLALEIGALAGLTADQKKEMQDGLTDRQAADRKRFELENETPLQRYRRNLNDPDRARDEVESAVIDELEGVRDSISSAAQKTLGIKNPILEALINAFIEQQLIKPILDAMAKAQGGGGGFLGTIGKLFGSGYSLNGIGGDTAGLESNFDKVFGRASGGFVQSGQLYRVNEGASPGRVEGFIPQGSGHIVPLGRMNAAAARGGVVQNVTIKVDAQGALLAGQVQQMVAQGMQQAAMVAHATGSADAQAKMASRARRRIPG